MRYTQVLCILHGIKPLAEWYLSRGKNSSEEVKSAGRIMISVAVLAKNSELTIKKCLDSLKRFSDVVLMDTGSSDQTMEIARQYENVRVVQGKLNGFGEAKDENASHCLHDWVLTVDSDEVISKELADEIFSLNLSVDTVYKIPRFNYYNGRHIKGCGWHPQAVYRLYNRTRTGYDRALVHENIRLDGVKVAVLKNPILHYPIHSISDFLNKTQLYSDLYVKKHRFVKDMSVFEAVIKAFFTFFRDYFIKKGFFLGFEGFVISVSNGFGTLFKCLKLIEENQRLSVSLIITTYNRPDALELVLKSVFSQSVLPLEIIVADDGSEKETRNLLFEMQKFSPVPLIHAWQENRGFRAAASRNNALRVAKGEYIIFIDGDILLDCEFIRDHIHFAKKGRFVQGLRCYLNEKGTTNIMSGQKISFWMSGMENRFKSVRSSLLSRLFSFTSRSLRGIRTCNLAVWKADIDSVNGFDEDFVGWGREDSEFVARLFHFGLRRYNLRFAAVGYHLYHPQSSRENLRKNDEIFEKTLREKTVRCQKGLKILTD